MSKQVIGVAEIVSRAEIGRIRLVHSLCENHVPVSGEVPPNSELKIANAGRVATEPDDNGYFCIHVRIRVHASCEAPARPQLAAIEATYELQYRLPKDMKPSRRALEDFARTNGIFNAWPYLRQFVAETSQRMEIPPIVLPLHRLNRKRSEKRRAHRSASTKTER